MVVKSTVVRFSPDNFHVDNFRGGAGQTHQIPPRT